MTLNTLGPLAKREAKRTMGTQWREREVDLSAFRALAPGNELRKGLRVFPRRHEISGHSVSASTFSYLESLSLIAEA